MFSSNASQVSNDANYIEQVFATHLYTGNGATQTITNGIDLAGEGGMVWAKVRSTTGSNIVRDSARGPNNALVTNETYGQGGGYATTFTSTGYTDGALTTNGATFASWTFRKAPKFFDVVTWTGDGTGNGRRLAHNLGSVPGCMIFKRTNLTSNWGVWHRTFSNPTDDFLNLNLTNGIASFTNNWGTSAPTATDFPVGSSNTAGQEFVAYLFAHNAGGFGLTGTDNVISCGSYTGNGDANGPVVSLGFEPQWLLIKSTGVKDWIIYDTMRGLTVSDSNDEQLFANTADPTQFANRISPTATGFKVVSANADSNSSGVPYIYIAIRRGPMRTPTTGTSVFVPQINTGDGTAKTQTVGFPPDLSIAQARGGDGPWWMDRLRAFSNTQGVALQSNSTAAEFSFTTANSGVMLDGTTTGQVQYTSGNGNLNSSTQSYANWFFRRAPGFFDEVCYTGTGSATTFAHNLGAVPELMIVKERSSPAGWWWNVYYGTANKFLKLNTTDAETTSTAVWNNTAPTSSVFSVGAYNPSNTSGSTYVNYLFASAPGVSKVTNFTGTGALQTINCGFTSGSRFVLIKRTDSTGDWYVWDSSRGLSSSTDPYLLLNSTAAEVTSTNWVDTTSTGFQVTAEAGNNVNINGASYIALAIS